MKTSISSWSFNAVIVSGQENQLSIIKKSKELGFDAIEFITLEPHDGSSQREYAEKLRAEAEKCGIAISCYSVNADMIGTDINDEVKRIKEQVDIAEILGTKLIRQDAASVVPEGERKYQGFRNVLPKLADACREITEYAMQKGIRTCVENHGQFCQDSDRVEMLVNTVAHENFGLIVDTGNFLCVDENPVTAVGRCAPYAFNVHIKDFILKPDNGFDPGMGFFRSRGGSYLRGTVAGHGVLPLVQCVSALKLSGYDGYLTLEFEGQEEINFALSAGAEFIKRLAQI